MLAHGSGVSKTAGQAGQQELGPAGYVASSQEAERMNGMVLFLCSSLYEFWDSAHGMVQPMCRMDVPTSVHPGWKTVISMPRCLSPEWY